MSAQASAPATPAPSYAGARQRVLGLSFPLIKAIAYEHQHLLPGSSSWFITACMLVPRFVLAAAIMAMWQPGALRGASRLEIRQGVGLALFAVFGMIFQNDGLQYTSASTSAFLTQIYAILIRFGWRCAGAGCRPRLCGSAALWCWRAWLCWPDLTGAICISVAARSKPW